MLAHVDGTAFVFSVTSTRPTSSQSASPAASGTLKGHRNVTQRTIRRYLPLQVQKQPQSPPGIAYNRHYDVEAPSSFTMRASSAARASCPSASAHSIAQADRVTGLRSKIQRRLPSSGKPRGTGARRWPVAACCRPGPSKTELALIAPSECMHYPVIDAKRKEYGGHKQQANRHRHIIMPPPRLSFSRW
jgi:hypothetical protein